MQHAKWYPTKERARENCIFTNPGFTIEGLKRLHLISMFGLRICPRKPAGKMPTLRFRFNRG
jgi:hypothetical protein